jgi:uncharacterized protein
MIDRAADILTAVTRWAKTQAQVRGLALVGSHARGAARPDSDIDLIALAKDPQIFRDPAWLAAIDWSAAKVRPAKWTDEEYGAVWSRRVGLTPEGEVVREGCRILYDPDGLLERLVGKATRAG